MAMIDSWSLLGFVKGVKTDTASTDAGVIDIPCRNYVIKGVTAYNAQGGSSATATLSVRGGAGGTGTTVVADAALTTHTGPTIVSERTVAATGVTPLVSDDKQYIRIGTASGVAGTTVDVAIYGYALP